MTRNILGQYLRDLRKGAKYTQEYVASSLDISRQAYSHYETGRAIPPNDTCFKLANLYGVPTEILIALSLENSIDVLDNPRQTYEVIDNIDNILKFSSSPKNHDKINALSNDERMLLYYYYQLDEQERKDLLDFLEFKTQKKHRPRS